MKKYTLVSLCVLHCIQLNAPATKLNTQPKQAQSSFKEIIIGTMTITGLCTALVEASNPSSLLVGAVASGAWAGLWGAKSGLILAGASQIGAEGTRVSTSQVLTPFGLIMATAAITKAAATALHPATVPGVLYYPVSAASTLVLRHAALVLALVIVAKRVGSLLQEPERSWIKAKIKSAI